MIQQLNPILLRVVLALLLAQIGVTVWLLADGASSSAGGIDVGSGAMLASQDVPDVVDEAVRRTTDRTARSSGTSPAFGFPTRDVDRAGNAEAPATETVASIAFAPTPSEVEFEKNGVTETMPQDGVAAVDLERVARVLRGESAPASGDLIPVIAAADLERMLAPIAEAHQMATDTSPVSVVVEPSNMLVREAPVPEASDPEALPPVAPPSPPAQPTPASASSTDSPPDIADEPALDPVLVMVADPVVDVVPEASIEPAVTPVGDWIPLAGWRYVETDLGLGLARWSECNLNAREADGGLAEGQMIWAIGSGVNDCTDWIRVLTAGQESWIPAQWLSLTPPPEA